MKGLNMSLKPLRITPVILDHQFWQLLEFDMYAASQPLALMGVWYTFQFKLECVLDQGRNYLRRNIFLTYHLIYDKENLEYGANRPCGENPDDNLNPMSLWPP